MNFTLSLIKIYRRVSGWLRNLQVPGFTYTTCKFYPSCSEYAELAVRQHGVVRGLAKLAGRVARCNPLTAGGIDYP